MTEAIPKSRLGALRRADFRTAIILIAVSVVMIWTALGYPLQESYGGVENSWYLSPALFPLMIAGCLLLLSLILMANAVRFIAAENQWGRLFGPELFAVGQRGLRTLLIAGYIGGYTWLLIPNVDFVLATLLFLVVFSGTFYVCDGSRAWTLLGGYLVGCILIWLSTAVFDNDRASQHIADGLAAMAIAFAVNHLLYMTRGEHRRALITIAVSVVATLLITVSFRFGLLVPLPTEGVVIEALQSLRGMLRS